VSAPQDDAKLRDAYAQLVSRRADATHSDAIPLERIRDLAEDRIHGDERARLFDAVVADPDARRELEILRALAAHRPRGGQRLMWAGATALAAAAVLILVWRKQHEREPDEMRGSRAPVELIAPADSARLTGSARFAWRRVSDASSYRLQIALDQGVPLYSISTGDTTTMLPDSVRIPPGEAAHWWVIALRRDGTPLRSVPRALRSP
jgi:hypothetical protein